MQKDEIQNERKQQMKEILLRLDRLPLSRWHIYMIISLGLVWIFDGYQVSLISLFRKYIVQQQSQQVFKSLATAYQIGCIVGSAVFGISAFFIGRKKIFLITLVIYAFGILFSLISKSVLVFLFGRFLTGISIGGQFTAIFTAIDEFLPPKYRGRVNIGIDGTWHLGGSLAAILNMIIGYTSSWRYLFTIGLFGILSLLMMRRNIPESARWLILKNRKVQADKVVRSIERAVQNKDIFLSQSQQNQMEQENIGNELVSERSQTDGVEKDDLKDQQNKKDKQKDSSQPSSQKNTKDYIKEIFQVVFQTFFKYKIRFLLAGLLMFTQAFFFNLIYYKFPAILENQFHLSYSEISLYMLPLSLSSFISTLFIGPLFDIIGRKQLILITYGVSGILLFLSTYLDDLIALEIFICIMFFFTSPAGSSANLIASQIFPTSSRTLMLFIMFIIGMFGGIAGVWSQSVLPGCILMVFSGVLGYIFCPKSQNKSLQQIQKM